MFVSAKKLTNIAKINLKPAGFHGFLLTITLLQPPDSMLIKIILIIFLIILSIVKMTQLNNVW